MGKCNFKRLCDIKYELGQHAHCDNTLKLREKDKTMNDTRESFGAHFNAPLFTTFFFFFLFTRLQSQQVNSIDFSFIFSCPHYDGFLFFLGFAKNDTLNLYLPDGIWRKQIPLRHVYVEHPNGIHFNSQTSFVFFFSRFSQVKDQKNEHVLRNVIQFYFTLSVQHKKHPLWKLLCQLRPY